MNIDDLYVLDIQPTQFYICEEKLKNIKKWLNPQDLSNFQPVPIIILNGKPSFTDGHTRALAAHSAGLLKIPLVWDKDELDLNAYSFYARECQKRQIYNINHLTCRILPQKEYKQLWNGWCDKVNEKFKKLL